MKIKKISYYSVSRAESGRCDCCGKAIQNICHVTTIENDHFNFGTTCFGKVIKDNLKSFQRKEFNRAIKSIKCWDERKSEWENMTEEIYREKYQEMHEAMDNGRMPWEEYEDIHTFEEYKDWYLNSLIPARLSDAETVIQRFGNLKY